jgi:hypothetical protein
MRPVIGVDGSDCMNDSRKRQQYSTMVCLLLFEVNSSSLASLAGMNRMLLVIVVSLLFSWCIVQYVMIMSAALIVLLL